MRETATDNSVLRQGEIAITIAMGKGKVRNMAFKVPLPDKAAGPHPLLVSGSSTDLMVLVGYDDYSKGRAIGGLLLGRRKESEMQWQEVKGGCVSVIAAYTPGVIKVGNNIYIDGKGGLGVKAIDLKSDC